MLRDSWTMLLLQSRYNNTQKKHRKLQTQSLHFARHNNFTFYFAFLMHDFQFLFQLGAWTEKPFPMRSRNDTWNTTKFAFNFTFFILVISSLINFKGFFRFCKLRQKKKDNVEKKRWSKCKFADIFEFGLMSIWDWSCVCMLYFVM